MNSLSFYKNNGKAQSDPVFQSIPKTKGYLLIWRVEVT